MTLIIDNSFWLSTRRDIFFDIAVFFLTFARFIFLSVITMLQCCFTFLIVKKNEFRYTDYKTILRIDLNTIRDSNVALRRPLE